MRQNAATAALEAGGCVAISRTKYHHDACVHSGLKMKKIGQKMMHYII